MNATLGQKASPAQARYIVDLLGKKRLSASPAFAAAAASLDEPTMAEYVERLKEQAPQVSKTRASQIIDTLLALPDMTPADNGVRSNGEPVPDVAAGRYAVERDGALKFFHVDRPTYGQWAGYTFVSAQASDDLYPVRGAAAREVLALIAEEPQEALERYGRELGVCGVCGRTLTDEESRAIGIGPVCRERLP